MTEWMQMVADYPRAVSGISAPTEVFNAGVASVINSDATGRPINFDLRVFDMMVRNYAKELGSERSEAMNRVLGEVYAWNEYHQVVPKPHTFVWGGQAWIPWFERFTAFYRDPSYDPWFSAGIFDLPTIEKYIKGEVDVQLVLAAGFVEG